MDPLTAYRLLVADVYELAGASRRSSEEMARPSGQTAARWHVMSVLSEEELTVAAAARRLGLARQSVQRVTDHLGADGLVTSRPNPADRRAPLLALSSRGQAVLQELFTASDRTRRAVLDRSRLGVEDLLQARETVRALVQAITEQDGGR